MTVQEVIGVLESQGWRVIREGERSRQFRHASRDGIVTLAGPLPLRVPPAMLRHLLLCARGEEHP